MIFVESLTVQEFRGIKNLKLELGGKNFAVCGRNGTGKSGVVDAIEFVLTGNISRLSGEGTKGLSVKDHGPHVDRRNRPDLAVVTAEVNIPILVKKVTLSRSVSDPKTLKVVPDSPEVRAVVARVARHPEFVLSRRELIKYILAEPGQRAKEVLALLRLDQIESLRTLLQRIANSEERDRKAKEASKTAAGVAFLSALGIPKPNSELMLTAVNERRKILNLPVLEALDEKTSIKDGLAAQQNAAAQSKVQKAEAKVQLAALVTQIDFLFNEVTQGGLEGARRQVAALLKDEEFLKSASREELIQSALKEFDGEQCPVCDTKWKEEEFRVHLSEKLKKYAAAVQKRQVVVNAIEPTLTVVRELSRLLKAVDITAAALKGSEQVSALRNWEETLTSALSDLEALLPLARAGERLGDLTSKPAKIHEELQWLSATVEALPEPSARDAARDYLTIGQERLETFRSAKLAEAAAKARADTAKGVFEAYGAATTQALEEIYANVQETFAKLYRLVNQDDEGNFEAKLTPSLGKLGFDVDFYGRGFFPPGAYHSEGHQDGMGLCLYLALMKHLAGDAFTFAVLDDVLMSVDSGHRREVSRLLTSEFAGTQFLLTTHDEIWLRHMKAAGLVQNKGAVHFRTWNVDHGPSEWGGRDVWTEIDTYLAANDVRAAAALLRHFWSTMRRRCATTSEH